MEGRGRSADVHKGMKPCTCVHVYITMYMYMVYMVTDGMQTDCRVE